MDKLSNEKYFELRMRAVLSTVDGLIKQLRKEAEAKAVEVFSGLARKIRTRCAQESLIGKRPFQVRADLVRSPAFSGSEALKDSRRSPLGVLRSSIRSGMRAIHNETALKVSMAWTDYFANVLVVTPEITDKERDELEMVLLNGYTIEDTIQGPVKDYLKRARARFVNQLQQSDISTARRDLSTYLTRQGKRAAALLGAEFEEWCIKARNVAIEQGYRQFADGLDWEN